MASERPSESSGEAWKAAGATTAAGATKAQRPRRRGPQAWGYVNSVTASFAHASTAMLRQQRLILAATITFLPVLLPLAMAFLSRSRHAADGLVTFGRMIDLLHISALSPLLALFFATMLVGGEAEAQTIAYALTRPVPRSAWVLGRFLAYLAITFSILAVSIVLTFLACSALDNFPLNASNLKLMLHFEGIIAISLMAYGSLAIFLGAVTRHSVVWGVVIIYAWQPVATFAKGLIDSFTILKHLRKLMPPLASVRSEGAALTVLEEFQREIFVTEATKAALALVVITALFLGLTIITVRVRQYAAGA